jgi:hypothetical protein
LENEHTCIHTKAYSRAQEGSNPTTAQRIAYIHTYIVYFSKKYIVTFWKIHSTYLPSYLQSQSCMYICTTICHVNTSSWHSQFLPPRTRDMNPWPRICSRN